MTFLEIKDLHAQIEDKKILNGVNLKLELGNLNVLMGPNGSGKSTLSNVLMGNTKYKVTKGDILIDGESILDKKVDERARLGLFMAFQYPQEISGVSINQFLRHAYSSLDKEKKLSLLEFQSLIKEKSKEINLDENFTTRYLNEGFSGGEKKKSEILQLLVLDPKLAILDETDSGLDIDALRIVAEGIKKYSNKNNSSLLITHYKRLPELLDIDKVFIMLKGKIVEQGGKELIEKLEEKGYGWLKNN